MRLPQSAIFAALISLAMGCASPPGALVGSPGGGTASGGSEQPRIADEVHRRINAHRVSIGLPPLVREPTLDALALRHSERMARGEVPFGHSGFEARAQRAREALNVGRMSENVATNNYPAGAAAERAVTGWLGSDGHRRNLEGDFDLTGIGVHRSSGGDHLITQIYGRSPGR